MFKNPLSFLKLDTPQTYKNMTVIPIILQDDKFIDFISIKEAEELELIEIIENGIIALTEKGKKLAESCYFTNVHTSYWMRKFFSQKTVMYATAIFLIILSTLKIITGLQFASQGMITEGFENLTDLIKIGIIGILSLKLKKDRLASLIIISLMCT